MVTALRGVASVGEGLQGPVPAEEILQISHCRWEYLVTIAEVDLGEQSACKASAVTSCRNKRKPGISHCCWEYLVTIAEVDLREQRA